MRSVIDLSWDSLPHDGASAFIGIPEPRDRAEDEELLDAWLIERQENIELGLYLGRTCELLGRIAAGGEVTPAILRRTRLLLRAIEEARPGGI